MVWDFRLIGLSVLSLYNRRNAYVAFCCGRFHFAAANFRCVALAVRTHRRRDATTICLGKTIKASIGLNPWHDYSRQPCKYKKKFWRVCPFVVSLLYIEEHAMGTIKKSMRIPQAVILLSRFWMPPSTLAYKYNTRQPLAAANRCILTFEGMLRSVNVIWILQENGLSLY